MSVRSGNKGFVLGGCLVVALLGAVVYLNTMDGEFVWDDVSSILLHEHVQDPAMAGQLFRENQHAFSGREGGRFYRPLVAFSFMLDFALARDGEALSASAQHARPEVDPFIFHVTNLAWHLAASILLFLLLVSLKAHAGFALAIAAIYAVHPLHTEAVAYISGRADMMAAAFLYAGLLATALQGSAMRRAAAATLCGLCFLGGLFSKESAAIFPLLLLLIIWLRARQAGAPPENGRGYIPHLTPLLGALAGGVVYFLVRSSADLPAAVQQTSAGLATRLVEVGQSLALYLGLLLWPTGLHMERTLHGYSSLWALAGYAFLVLMVAAIVWGWRRRPEVAAAFLWFILAWFPISGIFPLNAPMAEHWMYVPMAGFWWGLGLILMHLAASAAWRRAFTAATAILVTFFAIAAIERNEDWHDNTRLYEATLAQNPGTARVHYNLAVTHENLTGNIAGARRHFHRAAGLGIAAANPDVMLSLGDTLFALGRYEEAHTWFARLAATTGLTAAPYKPAAIAGIGRCYLALGYFGPASNAFQQVIQQEPGWTAQIRAWEAGAPL